MANLGICANVAKTSTPNSENQKIETQACLDDLVCPKNGLIDTGGLTTNQSALIGAMDGVGGMEIVPSSGANISEQIGKVSLASLDIMRGQSGARMEHWNTPDGPGGMEVFPKK
jgi:hypothetical protein